MARLKTKAAKQSLLRRVRKQRLNYITVLPSLITILNGLCGFAAIVFASKTAEPVIGSLSSFAAAGYMVLLAMIADVLDGRVARMSHNTSSFGGQLDSLCDIISFGVAPAFLMLKILEYKLALAGLNNFLETYLQRFFWLAAAAYISCTAIRLARFNVENEEDGSSHMNFAGLPAPAAAGVVVSLIIFHQETLSEIFDKAAPTYNIFENVLIYTLPFIMFGLALLMVSRICYSHVLNRYMRGKKPFAYFMFSLLVVGLIIWFRQPALVIGFCGFTVSGFGKWLYNKFSHQKNVTAEQLEIPCEISTNQ